MPTFIAEIHQNEYLAEGATEVNAIVTVTAVGSGPTPARASAANGASAAEIVIIDTSGSMSMPRVKWRSAVEATEAAIDSIRAGVRFAVIAGTHEAKVVYPDGGGLVAADDQTRAEAKRAVGRLAPAGGTAIGSWLTAARECFAAAAPGAICHAILL